MGRRESIIVGSCIGIVVPVCCFFAAWWASVAVLPERVVSVFAFGGLGVGVLLDALFLRRWVARVYAADLRLFMLLYLWLSIITYAVSMGMPVTLLVPGVLAGAYMGRRLRAEGAAAIGLASGIRRASLFAAFVILCASAASSFLVLRERAPGLELQRMFNSNYEFSRSMIAGIVVGGGVILVLVQYVLTGKAAAIAAEVSRHGN